MAAPVPKTEEMIRRLVALPSVSAADPRLDMSNRAVVETLAEWSESLGFHSEILPVQGAPDKWNLLARLGEGEGGLVLSGHTDTVPYDDEGWDSDPFDLWEHEGRLFGLGSTDMKGFFGLALKAAQNFRAERLSEPLYLLATADEESSMSGARSLAANQALSARYAIIGEPTGMVPVRAHKGIFFELVEVLGQSGHSSDPDRGRSAIEAMHSAITAILDWRRELQGAWRDVRFEVPVPTLNLGSIDGGDAPNRIAARCRLALDLRTLPGMDGEVLRQALRERVSRAVVEHGAEVRFESSFGGVPAFECPSTAQVLAVAEQLCGCASQAVMFGTEAPFMQQMGLETIVLGAGSIDVAHRPNEYLARAEMAPAIDIYSKMIHRFCVEAKPHGR